MGEDEEQKQSLGSQMADYAKQTGMNAGKNAVKSGVNAAGKMIGGVIKSALSSLASFLVSTAPYWLPIVVILVIAIMALTLILDLFTIKKEEDLSGFSTFSSAEMYYDYMRIWECTTLYKYRIGEGDGGKYVGPNGYYTVYYGGDKDKTYNLAYGIVISRDYNVDHFAKALGRTESEAKTILFSYTTDGQEFTHLSADGVESIFEEIVEEKRTYVKNNLGDTLASELKQYQIDALAAVVYQYGNIGNFKDVYSFYTGGQKDAFRLNFKVNGYTPFSQGWEGVNVGNNNRATANWNLFDTGVYAGGGYTLDPSNYGNSTSLMGGTIYYQNDYSNVSYGSGTIASCGCGPTSFAMIASDYTGTTITPEDAISWCGNSYYVEGSGTSWSYFYAAAQHFELPGSVVETTSYDYAIDELKKGNLVISSQGPGLFTQGGHFIVLSSVDSDGGVRVRDPNKNNAITQGYNSRVFTKSEINDASKKYWVFKRN